MPKCSRCEKKIPVKATFTWLEEAGSLSPKYCRQCYFDIIDKWEEGDTDIEDYNQKDEF